MVGSPSWLVASVSVSSYYYQAFVLYTLLHIQNWLKQYLMKDGRTFVGGSASQYIRSVGYRCLVLVANPIGKMILGDIAYFSLQLRLKPLY